MSYGTASEEEHLHSQNRRKPNMSSATATHLQLSSTSITPESGVSLTAPPTVSPLDRLTSYVNQTWRESRPWSQFFCTRSVALPPFISLSDHFATNIHLYRANYQVVTAVWFAIVMSAALFKLFLTLLACFAIERYCYWRITRHGKLVSRDVMTVVLISLFVIWITGIGLYIAIAVALAFTSIAIHATLHDAAFIETEIATV